MSAQDRLRDWLDHCKGCRRRAFEYRKWAREYDESHPHFQRYRAMSDKSWRQAWMALANARIQKELSHG